MVIQQAAPNPLPLLIVICLTIAAVSGSNRKWRTLLLILGWMLAGLVLGLSFGLLSHNMGAGGSAAAFAMLVMGSGAAIKEIIAQRKSKHP